MSNHTPQTAPAAQTDFTPTQADEVSGRPSQAEPTLADDRLKPTPESISSTDSYSQLVLPESLKGHEASFASFKQLAAELKLPAETAEKLIQWEASVAQGNQQSAEVQRADILRKWTEQTKEIFGPSYQQNIARALEAADRFGGPELRELLEVTGLGSHPVIVKTFHQISQQICEDASVSGRTRHSTDKTFAEALYGRAD